jgi:hypothetical protein
MYWLGSYYQTEQQATAMADDAVTTLRKQGIDGQSCFLGDQPTCHLFILPGLLYASWSTGNEVGELLFIGSLGFFSSFGHLVDNASRFGHNFRDLLAAGDTALVTAAGGTPQPAAPESATPPQPAITIQGIVIYHDVRGTLVPTTVVYLHELVNFAAEFRLSDFGVYSSSGDLQFFSPDARFQLIKKVTPTPANPATTKVVFDGPANLGQAPSGTLLFEAYGNFPSAFTLGKLTGHFNLTLSTAGDSRSFTVTIKEAPAPCKAGFHAKHGKCVKG